MIEAVFSITHEDENPVKRVIQDENLHYIHMIFKKDEGLPQHLSNSNIYMTVFKGILSIQLNDQDFHEYLEGSVLNIPFQTKMNVKNRHYDTLELMVIKAPSPKVLK